MDNAQLATEEDWDNIRKVAEYQHQEYYELLPDWTKYHKNEYKYLKQNIGFSIYGPPKQSTTSDESEKQVVLYNDKIVNDGGHYVTDAVCYKPDAQAVIDRIFDQIRKFGDGAIEKEFIYYEIIFNIMLPVKSESLKKEELYARPTPVFKIKRLKSGTSKTSASTSKAEPISYETWYIDIGGRVYKTWCDYKTSNSLPQCRMVLPIDGFYQPDRLYEITEKSSRVWLEIEDSPACATKTFILHGIDTAATVTGAIGLGLGVASLFTPAAPVVLGAAAASGVTGVWSLGRSSQNLIDRSVHEETINPLADRKAFCDWLSITGGVAGLAASGGNVLLTKVVRDGSTVSAATRFAYNSVLIGNLGINGVGIGYQAYCIYEEYQEEGRVSPTSLLNLGAHILFFGNSVINFQLAGNLIESTQGKVLDEYRNTIRSRRLRKQFNRAKRTAAENNTGQMHENAEVIQYINRKYELRLQNNISVPNQNIVTFERGVIKINDMTLIDPMKFALTLLSADRCRRRTWSFEDNNSYMMCALRNLVLDLLESYNRSNSGRFAAVFDIDGYENIFMELNHMKNALDIFRVLFKLAIILITDCQSPSDCLAKAVYFLWCYVRENFKRKCMDLTTLINDPDAQDLLQKFINCMFEHANNTVQPMIPAFVRYLSGSA